ncbi:MAG: class I tRNA ligase family protein [Candidatus Pacebacteria bacterium]|nr:class I tRNA ligase family protein [Candidatus Paceibacterota bacterium]
MTPSAGSGQVPTENKKYYHKTIESKWQQKWENDGIYKTQDEVRGKENYFELVEFTYPSGNLHVGHWYAYAVPDIFARYKRMQGLNVLYPIGFDAFGLPAENAAIKLGADPKTWTYEQMDKMRVQLRSMGAMFDWDKEIVSCDPEYYKWTQWMFNKFLEKDLVYRANTKVNWCPKDQTILANEQVVDGKCERCGTEVVQKDQDQWMLRITKYADRLIDDLEPLDWPNSIKEAQKNWIGRSEGAEIDFPIEGQPEHPIKVFTTRPDTIFGATFIGVSAGLAKKWIDMGWSASNEIKDYVEVTLKEQAVRDFKEKEKTGIFAGFNAINPATKKEIPIWITNYVLSDIGTGAIMAVPAHDERDFDFAKKFDLPIKEVVLQSIIPEGNHKIVKSNIGALAVITRKEDNKILLQLENKHNQWRLPGGSIEKDETPEEGVFREVLEETGYKSNVIKSLGSLHVQYKKLIDNNRMYERRAYGFVVEIDESTKSELSLTKDEADAGFSYEWIDPKKAIELMRNNPAPVGEAELVERYIYKKEIFTENGLLINSDKFDGLNSEEAKEKIVEFVGGKMTKTYKLRDWGISRQRYWGTPIPIVYDPEGKAHPVPDEHLPWTLPADVDHTPDGTSPLARSKELFERTEKIFGKGWKPEVETMDTFVDSSWYFYRYLDKKNKDTFASAEKMASWMPIDLYMGGAEHTTMHLLYSRFWVKALNDLGFVKENEAYKIRRNRGLILGPDGNKMSKSKGNVIDPDEIVERLGTDTVRMYLAFMGPYGVTTNYPWDPNGVVGVRRFLERVWKVKEKISEKTETSKTLHKVIKKMTEDIEDHKYNTSIAQMMTLLNEWDKQENISKEEYKTFLQLLSPFAPHITEELWYELGEKESIHLSAWPKYDEALVVDEEVTIGVQINGKLRGEITISKDESEEAVEKMALELPKIKEHTEGKEILKVVIVPNRIINIVIKA